MQVEDKLQKESVPSFQKKLRFIGILACVGLTSGFLLFEVFFRFGLEVYQCNDRLGWTFKQNQPGLKISRDAEFFQPLWFNSDGLRDRERRTTKPGDVFRIALMGDSMAAALQVSRSSGFSSLTERSLNAIFDRAIRVEILNAAIDGYGTAQQLLFYSDIVQHYDPDLVLLSVFPGNDLADNWYGAGNHIHYISYQCGLPYFNLVNGELVDLGLQRSTLLQKSIAERLFGFLRISTILSATTIQEGASPDFRLSQIRQREHPEPLDRAWALTKRLILEFEKKVSQDGSRFAVVIIPGKESFPEWRFRHMTTAERRAASEHIWPIEFLLEEFFIDNDIPHVNLIRHLSGHRVNGAEAFYFSKDSHFNERGHKKVAAILQGWIIEHCDEFGLPAGACRGAKTRIQQSS